MVASVLCKSEPNPVFKGRIRIPKELAASTTRNLGEFLTFCAGKAVLWDYSMPLRTPHLEDFEKNFERI